LLNRLEYQASGVLAAFLYIAPLAILLQGSAGEWMRGDYWLQPMAQDRLAAAAEIKMLKAAPDPVLCEMLSLCYWAGKEAQVDVFNMDQRFHLRAHSDEQLVNMIEQKRFSMIELESLAPFPLAGGTQSALTRSYRIVRLDDERVLFVPR
jgi:hypothetical protein